MRDEPPRELVDLLARLHLTTPEQVRAVQSRARKLAGDLPLVESVWIDALAQQKLLTPFQAAQCNAGRGAGLQVGPYILQRRLPRSAVAELFVAQRIREVGEQAGKLAESTPSGKHRLLKQFDQARQLLGANSSPKPQIVHLAVVRNLAPLRLQTVVAGNQNSIDCFPHSSAARVIAQPLAVGLEGETLWVAYQPVDGIPAAQWLSCHGRLPPAAVLEIARQMAAALAELEAVGISHGEIAAASLLLGDDGAAQLTQFGLQDFVESHNCDGNSAGTSRDICACGCLWWHLLAGRPPFADGNVPPRLPTIRQALLVDIRTIATDVPAALTSAIASCTRFDTNDRAQSFAELSKLLGLPTAGGRRALVNALLKSGRRINRRNVPAHVRRGLRHAIQPALAAAACILLAAAATWPLWRSRPNKPDLTSVASRNFFGHADPALTALEKQSAPQSQSTSDGNSKITKADRSIHLANYQSNDEAKPTITAGTAAAAAAPVVELSATHEIQGGSLRLTAGTIVRGKNQQRATIAVPPNGLIVDADRVRFENIDFLWRPRVEQITTPGQNAVIELQSPHVEFSGCTFQAVAAGSFALPIAIGFGEKSQRVTTLAPAMEVRMENCLIAALAAGFDCRTAAPVAIELHNTLQSGGGPLVRFPRPRRIDAPAAITLEHFTARGTESIVEFDSDQSVEASGAVTLCANACVFSLADDGALVCVKAKRAQSTSGGVLKSVEWTGQGSLVNPQARLVARRNGTSAGSQTEPRRDATSDDEANAENELSLEGLVSSPFEFAAPVGSDPAASQVRRWLAPLRSEQPPGIGDNLPHLPAVE
ncbi:MAG TPA: hypothetical protein VGJ15_01915 [Pirellulales bacterium]|jgi:serine/threonine protein kinase